MNKEDIISKIKHSTDNTIITLNNGSRIKLSDISDITQPIDYYSICNEAHENITVCREALSLEKWISYLMCDLNKDKIVSATFDNKTLFKSKSHSPIRNNSKWIYHELITKEPLRFTIIEYNDHDYIVESLEKINSLILFMYNYRSIKDLFNLSDNHEIWWRQLDSSFKENLMMIPVTVTRVKCNTNDTDSYKKFVSTLYDIPKVLQDEMNESDVYDY